ncbi:MAG TPA: hypothetical protein VE401_03795 [Solirubrobacterales bacterium]|nr:hypothetical protein [Solirubrobacterales bacterium]
MKRLKDEGKNQVEIAREVGVTKGTVAYHFRSLGSEPDERFARHYDWTAVQEAYDCGLSMRECCSFFGCNSSSWSQAVARGDVLPRPREMPLEELLVVGKKRGREN